MMPFGAGGGTEGLPHAGDRKNNIEVWYGGCGRFGERTVGAPINLYIA